MGTSDDSEYASGTSDKSHRFSVCVFELLSSTLWPQLEKRSWPKGSTAAMRSDISKVRIPIFVDSVLHVVPH
jgi:hypothetical protein